jgi:hypothetical protein
MADAATDTTSSPDISSIVGGDKALIDDLTKVQREKVSEESKAVRGVEGGMARDQARVDKAFKAEGIGPEELKPWDADKEHRRFETNPLEGFGSAGGLFAVIASAFTNAPMQNAIQGMAGAMNSIKEGNEEAYTRAFDSYKENQKLALERHKLQHEEYQDALSLMDHNMAAGQAKLRLLATKYGDQQTLTLLEHGMNDEVFKLQESRARSAETLLGLQDKLTESTLRKKAYESEVAALPKTGDPNTDAAHRLEAWQRTHGSDPKDPKQQLMGLFFKDHAQDNGGKGPTAEEASKFAQDNGITTLFGRGALTESTLDAKEIERRRNEKIAKGMNPDQAFEEATKEVNTAKQGATFDQKTLDTMADQAMAGDTSVFTNLGRGKQGSANVLALRKRIAEKLAEEGKTGADQAMAAAEYGGKKAALRVAGSREATIGMAAYEAKNFMTIARDASDKVARTRIVPFNEAVQALEARTSDPDLKAFITANNSLVNQYVRAISSTGAPTDLVRSHAYGMLGVADGPEAYSAVLDIMEKEMDAAISSPDQIRDYIMGKGVAPTTKTATPYQSKIIRYDKDGNRIQ